MDDWQQTTIHTVNGVCGSRKTTGALKWAAQLAGDGHLVIIASPSKALSAQSVSNIVKHGGLDPKMIKRIDSDTIGCGDVVQGKVIDFLKTRSKQDASHGDAPDTSDGVVLFITHKTLLDLPPMPSIQAKWHLLVDEVPQIDFEWSWNLTFEKTRSFVTDYIRVDECDENLYLRMTAKDAGARDALEAFASNKDNDDFVSGMSAYRDWCRLVISSNAYVHVNRASWAQFVARGYVGQLHIHAYRTPDALHGWASVQLLGAHVEESILAMAWGEKYGLTFKASSQISVPMPDHNSDLGRLISIHTFSERKWSRTLLEKLGGLSSLHGLIKEVFGDDDDAKFIYATNNRHSDSEIEGAFRYAARIPNSPYGLNEWERYNKAAFLTSLNNKTPHYAYMSAVFDISGDALARARYYETAYQGLMRCSARVQGTKSPCTFLIPDVGCATWLASLFPGCHVVPHTFQPDICGDARIAQGKNRVVQVRRAPKTSEQKHADYARRKTLRSQIGAMIFPQNSAIYSAGPASLQIGGRPGAENGIISDGNSIYSALDGLHFTQEARTSSSLPSTNILHSYLRDWASFRDALRDFANTYSPSKEEATLINGALMRQSADIDTIKGRENVVAVCGLWFDVDGGAFAVNDWFTYFSDLKFIATNSYNNGLNGAVKYRLVFPTAMALLPDDYEALWDLVAQRIVQAGFYVGTKSDHEEYLKKGGKLPFSGVDVSKRVSNSFFYLPSIAGLDYQKDEHRFSFFRDNWSDATVILDPCDWLSAFRSTPTYETKIIPPYERDMARIPQNTAEIPHEATRTPQQEEDHRQKRITRAIEKWREKGHLSGHVGFFGLQSSLALAGVSYEDAREILLAESEYSLQPSVRRAELKSNMKKYHKTQRITHE